MVLPGFNKDTWSQKNIQRLKTFVLGIFVFCILLGVYDNGLTQRMQYIQYKRNLSDYDVVWGTIIDNSYSTNHFGNIPIYKKHMQTIAFTYNGVEHTVRTNAYGQYNIGDIVRVAVNKSNYTTVSRCIPYEITKYEKELYVRNLIILLIVFALYIIDRRHFKFQEYKMKCNIKNDLAEKEKRYNEEILERQSLIFKHIPIEGCMEKELSEQSIVFSNIKTKLNLGTLWLLENYYKSEKMKKIFNLLSCMLSDEYFEYLKRMYEQGFPENYYVLAEKNSNYYCCCKESERLYMYSKAIGITNTPYETVYDYIIEQIDKR